MRFFITVLTLSISLFFVSNLSAISLKDNIAKAKPGDYIVTARNKNYTLLLVTANTNNRLYFEEITVPLAKIPKNMQSWKEWVRSNAPGHTGWVRYEINLATGQMGGLYSYTQESWYEMEGADAWLSTLLNLSFNPIPEKERKKVGSAAMVWNPKMIFEGQEIAAVPFDAWRAKWPKDNTELSGKLIEIYLPADSQTYPAYFPYWLQISGMIGKASLRIVDSGKELLSPKMEKQQQTNN